MKNSDLRKLQDRWLVQDLSVSVSTFLGNLSSPFPVLEDGFVDFRGLTISDVVKNLALNSIDLSGAVFVKFGQMGMCRFEDVKFCSVSLGTNIGNSFKSCDFYSAKLSGAVFRGTFESCDFSMADLRGSMGKQTKFIRCKFVGTNFTKALFTHCMFEDCSFTDCKFGSGSFSFSRFIRSPLISNELGNTLLENVIFQ